MKPIAPALLERLHELSLVEVDTLAPSSLGDTAAAALIAAYVADLEDALGQARRVLRDAHAELATGPDPLNYVEQSPDRRVAGGDAASRDATDRVLSRAAARRELARLEELIVRVLPRLTEADRRFVSILPR